MAPWAVRQGNCKSIEAALKCHSEQGRRPEQGIPKFRHTTSVAGVCDPGGSGEKTGLTEASHRISGTAGYLVPAYFLLIRSMAPRAVRSILASLPGLRSMLAISFFLAIRSR